MKAKQPELVIGVHDYKPLVYNEQGKWTGLEIELWEAVADNLDLTYTYEEREQFTDLLTDTARGELDVSMAGITRTTERAEDLAMSFFTLDTGLGIATVPVQSFSIGDLLKSLLSKQTLVILGILVVFSIVVAHIYWLIESGDSVSEVYGAGILESFWWSIVTFSTVGYGDIYPATLAGKAFGIVAILSGLAIFGLYIGQLSASLALVKISSKIGSADDLAGKRVGVKRNTTAVHAVTAKKATAVEYDTLADVYEAAVHGKVDAVVADMPVLQDAAKENGLAITGQAFSRQAYSFVLPKKSELLRKINLEIIKLRESGRYDELYSKYLTE